MLGDKTDAIILFPGRISYQKLLCRFWLHIPVSQVTRHNTWPGGVQLVNTRFTALHMRESASAMTHYLSVERQSLLTFNIVYYPGIFSEAMNRGHMPSPAQTGILPPRSFQ